MLKKNHIKALIAFGIIIILICMVHLIGNSFGMIKNHFGL